MKKRIALFVLILFVLHAFCAAAEAPESSPRVNKNGKKETDSNPVSSFFHNGRFYAVDSLQDGCYPVYMQRLLLNLNDKDNNTYEQAISLTGIEKISGSLDFAYTNGVLYPYTAQLKQPGQTSFRIRAESKHLYLDQEYTLYVIDQKDDPEWVMPKSSVVLYAEPGRKVNGWAAASKATDLDPYRPCLYTESNMPSQGSNGDYEFVYDSPGTYNPFLKLDWGSFFTVTNVTALVYPKDEWYGKDETVTVKNYAELKKAINETRVNNILISPQFRYGKDKSEPMYVYGKRKVTISPENGESAVIDGMLSFCGDGTVVLDRVDIASGAIGLDLSGGITVTAGRVVGGSAPDSGCPAVAAWNSTLTIEEAVGGDGKTGIGGDGIYAMDGAVIEVKTARGGSAAAGVGGWGVVAMDGAKVTVTGEAVGGNGQIACGKGTLAGLNGEVELRGTALDGTLLEAKKPVDPGEITSYALLQNALRSGKTDIQLSPKFRITEKNYTQCHSVLPLFASGDQVITISGPSPQKPLALNGAFRLHCGRWKFNDIHLSYSDDRQTLFTSGTADVEWNGDLAASGKGLNACIAVGSSCLTVNGNIVSSVKSTYPAVALDGSPTVTINGSITEKGNSNAIVSRGGRIRMNGDISSAANTLPAIVIAFGEMDLTGNITGNKVPCALLMYSGILRIQGDVACKAKDYALGVAGEGCISVEGSLTASGPAKVNNFGGRILLNGTEIQE